jgi:hypothetical protein
MSSPKGSLALKTPSSTANLLSDPSLSLEPFTPLLSTLSNIITYAIVLVSNAETDSPLSPLPPAPNNPNPSSFTSVARPLPLLACSLHRSVPIQPFFTTAVSLRAFDTTPLCHRVSSQIVRSHAGGVNISLASKAPARE